MKKRFAVYMHKQRFENGILRLEGQRITSIIILISFFAALLFLLGRLDDMPWFINLGLQASLAFLAYAIIDMLYSKSSFSYDTRKQTINLKRRSLRQRFSYQGEAKNHLRVRKKAVDNSSLSKSYNLELVFDSKEASVRYQLSKVVLTEPAITQSQKDWQEKLNLNHTEKPEEEKQ